MAKRVGSRIRKSHGKLKKSIKEKGKFSITQFLQEFKEGDSVVLKLEPAYHKGQFFPRFHGRTGIISGKQDNCYQVMVKDGNKLKKLIVHPAHLKRV